MTKKGGFGFMLLISIALVGVIAISSIVPAFSPIIETNTTISPDKIKNNEQSTLTIELRNKDKSNAHDIELQFTTYTNIHIYLGKSELSSANNEGTFTYHLTLQPGQEMSQPFIIQVDTLPVGIAKQEYSIKTEVFADGNQVSTAKETLTVEEN